MATRELYQIAGRFRDAKIWERLYDTDLFAVRYEDGQTGYCSVMGNGGEHFALGLYMGDEGLSGLLAIISQPETPTQETMFSQSCLMCSFENKEELTERDTAELLELGLRFKGRNGFPQFRRHAKFKLPWYISEDSELSRLAVALEAALEVDARIASEAAKLRLFADPWEKAMEKLGFGEGSLPVLTRVSDGFALSIEEAPQRVGVYYPSPMLAEEMEIVRLKKKKIRPGQALLCDISIIPTPVDGEPPYFPMAMLLLSQEEGIVAMDIVEDYERGHGGMLSKVLGYIRNSGKPERLLATSPRALHLLGNVAKQIGLRVELVEEPLEMDELKADLYAFLDHSAEDGSPLEDDGPERRAAVPAAKGTRKPRGVCFCCGREFSKSGILRHLESCKERKVREGDTKHFIVRVEDMYSSDYFLYLDVMADTKLKKLDAYLRDTWVECCGHLSAFFIGEQEYYSHPMELGGLSMNYALEDVAEEGGNFSYEYDFGSTTTLRIYVTRAFHAAKRRDKIALLARNIAPVFPCAACGKPATLVCGYHYGEVEENAYCEECAPAHECGDEAMMPIVNSPRCGVCAYGG